MTLQNLQESPSQVLEIELRNLLRIDDPIYLNKLNTNKIYISMLKSLFNIFIESNLIKEFSLSFINLLMVVCDYIQYPEFKQKLHMISFNKIEKIYTKKGVFLCH